MAEAEASSEKVKRKVSKGDIVAAAGDGGAEFDNLKPRRSENSKRFLRTGKEGTTEEGELTVMALKSSDTPTDEDSDAWEEKGWMKLCQNHFFSKLCIECGVSNEGLDEYFCYRLITSGIPVLMENFITHVELKDERLMMKCLAVMTKVLNKFGYEYKANVAEEIGTCVIKSLKNEHEVVLSYKTSATTITDSSDLAMALDMALEQSDIKFSNICKLTEALNEQSVYYLCHYFLNNRTWGNWNLNTDMVKLFITAVQALKKLEIPDSMTYRRKFDMYLPVIIGTDDLKFKNLALNNRLLPSIRSLADTWNVEARVHIQISTEVLGSVNIQFERFGFIMEETKPLRPDVRSSVLVYKGNYVQANIDNDAPE